MKKPGGYFSRIRHTNLEEIRDYVQRFYMIVKHEYFLGIRGKNVFDSSNERYASLYVVVGIKK